MSSTTSATSAATTTTTTTSSSMTTETAAVAAAPAVESAALVQTRAVITRNYAAERAVPPPTVKAAFDQESFKNFTEAKSKEFQFWKTQPMAAFNDPDPAPEDSGPIEADKPITEIRAT